MDPYDMGLPTLDQANRPPEATQPIIKPWQRLWVKLALFATVGVLVTHVTYMVLATRASSRALEEQVALQGRLLAHEMAFRLSQDQLSLARLPPDLGYLILVNGDRVESSTLPLVRAIEVLPRLSSSGEVRVKVMGDYYLDVPHPVSGPRPRVLHLGFALRAADTARQQMSLRMGMVASFIIVLGVLAAFAVGGRLARPVGHIAATLRRMDPSQQPVPLPEEGQDEIGFLVHRFNEMRHRLFMVHLEEEQIRRERLRMEKLAALGTLIAGVAHEINNPLAGLKNCVQRLGREGLAAERRTEYLNLMRDSLNRIQKVVQQLLHYSRTVTSNHTTVRAVDILGSTEQFLLSTVLRSANKRLEKEIGDSGDRWVQVDASQIEQALTNLILNALYVTPSGSAVRLKMVSDPDRVGFQVRDRGPGIAEEIRSQIEDPFFTTKPEGEGTGMGLYVTRNIVESHKGELAFEFPEEGGTVATLWLPEVEAPSSQTPTRRRDRVNPTQEVPVIGSGGEETTQPDASPASGPSEAAGAAAQPSDKV